MFFILRFLIKTFFSVFFEYPVKLFYQWLYKRLKEIDRPYDLFAVIMLIAIGLFNVGMLYQCFHAGHPFLSVWW